MVIGDGVMADGRGGWPDLQGEDRVLRERLSATLQLSLFVLAAAARLPTLLYDVYLGNFYLVAIRYAHRVDLQ